MSAVAIIPARYASSRFPGKPIIPIAGVPMIVRVCTRVSAASEIDAVIVATDDGRIADVVQQAGHRAVMTASDLPSGTDRVAAALSTLSTRPDVVVNVQGDEPLIAPEDLDAVVQAARAQPNAIGTLARPLRSEADADNSNVVKVVFSNDGHALYFSRARIPSGAAAAEMHQHVGVYAFSPALLERFVTLSPSRLEGLERLEQLRALENGIAIHVTLCVSPLASIAVDTPEDVKLVEQALNVRGASAQRDGRSSRHAP